MAVLWAWLGIFNVFQHLILVQSVQFFSYTFGSWRGKGAVLLLYVFPENTR